jgi:hypothetical protein
MRKLELFVIYLLLFIVNYLFILSLIQYIFYLSIV